MIAGEISGDIDPNLAIVPYRPGVNREEGVAIDTRRNYKHA